MRSPKVRAKVIPRSRTADATPRSRHLVFGRGAGPLPSARVWARPDIGAATRTVTDAIERIATCDRTAITEAIGGPRRRAGDQRCAWRIRRTPVEKRTPPDTAIGVRIKAGPRERSSVGIRV